MEEMEQLRKERRERQIAAFKAKIDAMIKEKGEDETRRYVLEEWMPQQAARTQRLIERNAAALPMYEARCTDRT
jgi:hypothetical protein